ncbi:MAG: hypothetical protein IKX54_01320 [Lachnospiraceae bacterium]|nr:hypothetical protein [Lachnospiraceae bacterium]
MHSRGRRGLSIILAIAMVVLTLPERVFPAITAKAADTRATVSYMQGSDLSDIQQLMNSYGYIIFSSLRSHGHQHANVMTAEFDARNAQGDVDTSSECTVRDKFGVSIINYIQSIANIQQIASGSNKVLKFGYQKDTLIVGNNYTYRENGNEKYLNNCKVESSGTVILETDTQKYIDLDNLKKNFEYYNRQLIEKEATSGCSTSFGDMNRLKINVTATSGLQVLNLKASDLSQCADHPITVDFPSNTSGGILINIDMNGASSIDFNKIMLAYGGREKVLNEDSFGGSDNRIYWNFYDSSKADKQFRGTINLNGYSVGTVIAPNATLNTKNGINGMAVANTAFIQGESHRINPFNLPAALPLETGTKLTLIKTYEGEDLTSMDAAERDALLANTEFTLYSEGGSRLETKALSWDSENNRAIVTFDTTCDASGNSFKFTVKETKAPEGYLKDETVVDVKVTRDVNTGTGELTAMYKKSNEGDSAYSTDFPAFNNTKKPAITPEVEIGNWNYGDSAAEPSLAEGSNPGNGGVVYEYKVKGADDSTYTTTVPKNAGEYTVRATVSETDGYLGGVGTADFTIYRAGVFLKALETEKNYGDPDPDHFDVIMYGIKNGDDESVIEYTISRRPGEDAGYYTIDPVGEMYQGNYQIIFANGTFTINKVEDEAVVVEQAEVMRGGKTVDLSDLVSGNDGDVTFAIEGGANGCSVDPDTGVFTSGSMAGTVRVKVTIAEGKNHTGKTEYITVTVTDKNAINPEVTISDWEYSKQASTPELTEGSNPGNGSVTYEYKVKGADDSSYTTVVPSNAGEYTVRATITETTDYAGGVATADFKIKKAEDPAEFVEGDTTTVVNRSDSDGHEIDLTGFVIGNVGTVKYEIVSDGTTATDAQIRNGKLIPGEQAGEVKVRISVEDSKNYSGKTVKEFTITVEDKKELTADANITGWNYGAYDPAANAPSVTATDGETTVPVDANAVTYEYKKKGADDNEYTTAVPVDAGEYTVRATIPETAEYQSATATKDFTIAKTPDPAVVGDSASVQRGGHTIDLSKLVNGAVGNVTYEIIGNRHHCTVDASTGAFTTGTQNGGNATVTVRVKIAESDNHTAVTKDISVHLTQKTPINPEVSIEGWTYGDYDARENSPTITGAPENATVTYEYKKEGSDEAFTTTVPTEAGSYTVRATVSETSTTAAAQAFTSFTIEKADITPVVSLDGWDYGETANSPSVTVTDSNGDDVTSTAGSNVKYEYKLADADDSAYTTTVPTKAGTYVVRATVLESKNHKEGVSEPKEFKIEKTEDPAEIETVYGKDRTKVNTLETDDHEINLNEFVKGNVGDVTYEIVGDDATGSYIDKENGKLVAGSNSGKVTVRVTIAESDNHTSKTQDIELTIVDKDEVHPTLEISDWTYGQTASEPRVSNNTGGGAVTYEYKKAGADDSTYTQEVPTDAGDYVVRATVAETSDTKPVTLTKDFTIEQETMHPTVNISGWTYGEYDETVNGPSVEGNIGGGKVTYEYKKADDSESAYTDAIPTEAGNYVVRAKVEETNNHKAATTDPKPFTIAKAPVTATVDINGWTYGDTPEDPTTTAADKNNEDVTSIVAGPDSSVTYEYKRKGASDATYSTTVPTKAGDYVVRATVAETDNYKGAVSEGCEFTIAKADLNEDELKVTVENGGWTYGETAKKPSVSGNAGNGAVTYEYKPYGADDSEYTTEVPTEAGKYVVRATIDETDNYKGASATTIFDIAKADNPTEVTNTSNVMRDNKTIDLSKYVVNPVGDVTYEIHEEDAEFGCSIKPNGEFTSGNKTGEVRVRVTIAETDNYKGKTEIITVTVTDKKTLTPELTISDWNYDEDPKDPSLTGNLGNATIKYEYKKAGEEDSEFTTEVPKDAGKYIIRATIPETQEYCGAETAAEFEIFKVKDPAEISTEDKDNEVKVNTLPDDGHKIDLNQFVDGAEGDVTFEIVPNGTDATDATIDADGVLTPGEKTGEVVVRVTIADSDNHTGKTQDITIVVTEKDPITAEVKIDDWTYGDPAQEPSLHVKDADGEEIPVDTTKVKYEYKKDGEPDSRYTEEVPTDAGDYIIRVTVPETEDCKEATATAEFTIKKAKDPAVVDAGGDTVTVNTSDKDDNKVDLNELVEGAKGDVKFEIIPDETTADDAKIDKDGNLIPGKQTGEVKVLVTIEGSDNYEGKTEIITVVVTDKKTEELKVTKTDSTYGDKPSEPTFTPPTGTKKTTVIYSGTKADGTDVTYPEGTVPTDAGTYIVTVVCETGDTVYTGKAEYVIHPQDISDAKVTLSEDPVYDGTEKKVSVKVVMKDGTEVTAFCEIRGDRATEVGTHKVTITAVKGSNYTGSLSAAFRILAQGSGSTTDPVTNPDDPEDPPVTDPTQQDKPQPDSPKTGDVSVLLWWTILLGVATVLLVVAKKRREEREETLA